MVVSQNQGTQYGPQNIVILIFGVLGKILYPQYQPQEPGKINVADGKMNHFWSHGQASVLLGNVSLEMGFSGCGCGILGVKFGFASSIGRKQAY